METFFTILHVCVAVLLVLVVLVQSGKGAELSSSFTGGGQTVFGASGGANFFQKFTAGLAATFMLTSIALTYMTAQKSGGSTMDQINPASLPKVDDAPKAEVDPANPGKADAATGDNAAPKADAPAKKEEPASAN